MGDKLTRDKLAQEAQQRKEQLLERGKTAPIPHELGRDFLPEIVAVDKRNREAIILYVYLLAHVNGKSDNERYMSAWVSTKKIAQDTGIDKNRIKALVDLLEAHGYVKSTYEYSQNKREKLYYPMYCGVNSAITERGNSAISD